MYLKEKSRKTAYRKNVTRFCDERIAKFANYNSREIFKLANFVKPFAKYDFSEAVKSF